MILRNLWEIKNLNFDLEILFFKHLCCLKKVHMCIYKYMYLLIFLPSYLSFKQFPKFNSVLYEQFTKAWKI